MSVALQVAIIAPLLLLSVVLHEIAHGLVAYRLGDDTARRAGRLTLNPLSHIDPFGSIALPLMLAIGGLTPFGWAKPVPVRFDRLRNPKRDMVAVAVAGPATNIVLALLFAALAHVLMPSAAELAATAGDTPVLGLPLIAALVAVRMNIMLAVFNLIPIPPLDGGRVLFGLLPRGPALALARLEPYGMFIVMALLFTGALRTVLVPISNAVFRALL
jgi:Zn-dependent protease